MAGAAALPVAGAAQCDSGGRGAVFRGDLRSGSHWGTEDQRYRPAAFGNALPEMVRPGAGGCAAVEQRPGYQGDSGTF